VLVAELRGIGDDKIATIIAGQRHRPASGDGPNFQQTLNASSRQSRRVSDGLSQHCIQLRLWELIALQLLNRAIHRGNLQVLL
jgi:hypothetical protein